MVSGAKPFLWSPDGRRYYVRKGGRYFRIKAERGTEAFDAEYWAIRNGRSAPGRSSWGGLVEGFRASDRWARLAPRTRADYEKALAYIVEHNGAKDAARVTRRDAIAAQEANRHRVHFGNLVVSVMSVLIEHAIDLGLMRHNPVKGARRVAIPKDKRKPHLPWPDWAVEVFRAEAGPLPRLIFEVGVGTVQRPSDWLQFTWGDYDGDSLRVVQSKTGVALTLPCTAALKAALDAARPEGAGPGVAILRGPRGGRMRYKDIAEVMLSERRRLGVEQFDLHALRYRGVRELAFAGCDDDEIAAYSGHTSKAMIRKYAGEARQLMRALSARDKRG